ncbi:hypothetical protein QFC21_000021 [Naganishia friedmannii]|uniref:Uncharacterized protein n=1 Tax=Naganishia friedmannii TaxID=89922 RepID=A0ACC2WCV5_9TREE|nr:hypothetical protein QFC21_000021 [Naganishia friedmannii]
MYIKAEKSGPRYQGLNFYHVQEDMLKEAAKKGQLRVAASILKYLNQSLIFPESSATYSLSYYFSTADHNVAHQLFLVKNEKAYDRAFNILDGKPMRFSELWPNVIDYFGLLMPSPPADDAPDPSEIGKEVVVLQSAAEFVAQRHGHNIEKYAQNDKLDKSAPKYATWGFLDFATGRT